MFTRPTPVLSLGSDWSLSLSSHPPPTLAGEQTSLSGWCVLVGTDPLCGNLSTLPSTPLWLCSPPWLWSFPPLPPTVLPAKGLPSVRKPFLLHSSLPLVQVPSLFFFLCCFFFLLPYPGTWWDSCLLGGLTSSASIQWVFYRSSSTCRCISDVSVGREVISASYSSAIFSSHSAKLVFSIQIFTYFRLNAYLLYQVPIFITPKFLPKLEKRYPVHSLFKNIWLFLFNFYIFIQLQFTFHKIHLFLMYYSMVLVYPKSCETITTV